VQELNRIPNVLPSLDDFSEAIIQRLLRSRFASHTIIAVAHKLDTILDFDKVVVMDQGQLVEYGQPHSLLKQQSSHFRSLYKKADGRG
jgi:ATP-binding cassette subfamily C (CFTR/MRP) protein 1